MTVETWERKLLTNRHYRWYSAIHSLAFNDSLLNESVAIYSYIYIYIYIYMCVCVCVCVFIYSYISNGPELEFDRKLETASSSCFSSSVACRSIQLIDVRTVSRYSAKTVKLIRRIHLALRIETPLPIKDPRQTCYHSYP